MANDRFSRVPANPNLRRMNRLIRGAQTSFSRLQAGIEPIERVAQRFRQTGGRPTVTTQTGADVTANPNVFRARRSVTGTTDPTYSTGATLPRLVPQATQFQGRRPRTRLERESVESGIRRALTRPETAVSAREALKAGALGMSRGTAGLRRQHLEAAGIPVRISDMGARFSRAGAKGEKAEGIMSADKRRRKEEEYAKYAGSPIPRDRERAARALERIRDDDARRAQQQAAREAPARAAKQAETQARLNEFALRKAEKEAAEGVRTPEQLAEEAMTSNSLLAPLGLKVTGFRAGKPVIGQVRKDEPKKSAKEIIADFETLPLEVREQYDITIDDDGNVQVSARAKREKEEKPRTKKEVREDITEAQKMIDRFLDEEGNPVPGRRDSLAYWNARLIELLLELNPTPKK